MPWLPALEIGTAQLLAVRKSRQNLQPEALSGMVSVLANHHHRHDHDDDDDDDDDDVDEELTVFLLHVWLESTMQLCI